jgi:lysyl-tRNA synthetase class 2
MKAEASGISKEQGENGKAEAEQSPVEEVQNLELSEDQKAVPNLLKANSPVDLNDLKGQTGLSNKKWDKAIKGLTKNKLAKVEKTDTGLFVSVV